MEKFNDKISEIVAATKINELLNRKDEKKCTAKKVIIWTLAIIGAVAAIAAIAYAVYRYFAPDYLEDFEDDFDDFDDGIYEDQPATAENTETTAE